MKNLKNDLDMLLSGLLVKARKQSEYTVIAGELEQQVKKVGAFNWAVTLELAEVDDIKSDEPDDEKLKAALARLTTYITNTEHHYNGGKGAKTRFGGVLGSGQK